MKSVVITPFAFTLEPFNVRSLNVPLTDVIDDANEELFADAVWNAPHADALFALILVLNEELNELTLALFIVML
jgi:hypothetical protein